MKNRWDNENDEDNDKQPGKHMSENSCIKLQGQ